MRNNNFFSVILIALIFIIGACTEEKTPLKEPIDEQPMALMDLEKMEQTLEDFSAVLPEALTEPELAKIVYDEAKRNEADEAYALWSKIADQPTNKGLTLRKNVQNVLKKRSLGKLTNAEGLTSAMDEVDYLQVYIHDFENWDGKIVLPSTFTPLTINDVDITELLVYDTLGSSTFLDVSDNEWEPDYAIAIVSINEGIIAENLNSAMMKTTTTLSTAWGIFCEKITVRKPRSLEPWYKGHADMVVAQKDESSNGYIYKVNNPSGQSCNTIKSKTADKYIDDGSSTHIKVYEFDLLGINDWVIEDAYLYGVTSGGAWNMSIIDEGKYYMCSDYVRCGYKFIYAEYTEE